MVFFRKNYVFFHQTRQQPVSLGFSREMHFDLWNVGTLGSHCDMDSQAPRGFSEAIRPRIRSISGSRATRTFIR